MISIGRYKTPVTAMIIGAKNRVWGIVIKYYEINSSKESVTFIFNPCYELLIFVLTMNEEQRRMVLDNSLFKGSVK